MKKKYKKSWKSLVRNGSDRGIHYNSNANMDLALYIDLNGCDGLTGMIEPEQIAAAKARADLSGNPKIWTADQYSQKELRSLIPTR